MVVRERIERRRWMRVRRIFGIALRRRGRRVRLGRVRLRRRVDLVGEWGPGGRGRRRRIIGISGRMGMGGWECMNIP